MWLWGLKMCHVYSCSYHDSYASASTVCNSSCLPTEGPLYRNDKSAPPQRVRDRACEDDGIDGQDGAALLRHRVARMLGRNHTHSGCGHVARLP